MLNGSDEFQEKQERISIIRNIKRVYNLLPAIAEDRTVYKTLELIT